MTRIAIHAVGVSKEYNRRSIFKDISFVLQSPGSLAVTGRNGMGKSTLSKILAGLMRPTRGSVSYTMDDRPLDGEAFKHHVGFVSPYLNLYDEFSASENLLFLSRIRSSQTPDSIRMEELLKQVGLWGRRDDPVGAYSSGMKQRLKYAFALLHQPRVLILDEPSSNLDEEGIRVVQDCAAAQRQHGILIVATNDADEARWCEKEIQVGVAPVNN